MSTPCAICGAPDPVRGFRAAGLRFLTCSRCGTRALDEADRAPPRLLYDEEYIAPWAGEREQGAIRGLRRRFFERLLARLPIAPPRGGRWLDVGCGMGFSFAVAARCGLRPLGLDLNRAALRHAPGPTVCASLTHVPLRGASFHAVAAVDVIEHLADPVRFLREVQRLLVPGGFALVLTPDAGSLHARAFGASWPHYRREHLHYFGARTLDRAGRTAGLETVRVKPFARSLSIEYMAAASRRWHTTGLATFVQALARALPRSWARASWAVPAGDRLAVFRRPLRG